MNNDDFKECFDTALDTADKLIDTIAEWMGFTASKHRSACGYYLSSMDFREGEKHCSTILDDKLTEEGYINK